MHRMKKTLHNSVSMVLALLVLVSTFSFSVDKHFCGSMLVDMAVFSKAKTCGMEMHREGDVEIASEEEDFCCTNESIAVEGQDELKISFNSLDFPQQIFLSAFTHSYLILFEGSPQDVDPFRDYSPPLLVADIQVLDQVFLI